MLLAMVALGCGWRSSSDGEVPAPVPTAEPEFEYTFVQASRLRLREAPSPDAAWSPLAINTRVRVVGHEGDWMRIIAPDGRTGFIYREFVGDEPLSLAGIRQQIAQASDAQGRVRWYERGAALAPTDPEMLAGLVAAYREAGRSEDAARVEAIIRSDEADRFDRWFVDQVEEVSEITTALGTVATADALIELWERARTVTLAMGEPLSSLYDPQTGFVEGDPKTMLAERMPWAELAMYAGGRVPALELAPEPWVAAARRTPEAWDDAFFELVTRAYQTASARGWARWQRQSWDYGGCSTFGNGEGLHLDLLQRTDALGTVPQVSVVVARIREAILQDIDKLVADEFPYCLTPGSPTPTDQLVAEARAILAVVVLTEEEQGRIDARVAERFGRPGR